MRSRMQSSLWMSQWNVPKSVGFRFMCNQGRSLKISLLNSKIIFRMMLVMYHTLVHQQLLVPNVPSVVSKKINVIRNQILNVGQTSTGLNVITALNTIVNMEWFALKRVQLAGLKVVWLKINVYAILDIQDIQVLAIILNSIKLNLDPYFPDLNKCVPERECPSNKPGMEVPDIPEDMPSGIQPKYDI